MAKVQISMDDGLLERLDKHADSVYMSRSGFISFACAQIMNSNEMVLAIKDISLAIRKIADNGVISDEERLQLEDFERVVKMISGVK